MEGDLSAFDWAQSLEGWWRKSAFRNGLWQEHPSITQLPTSVWVGKKAASWYRFVKAQLQHVHSCVCSVRGMVLMIHQGTLAHKWGYTGLRPSCWYKQGCAQTLKANKTVALFDPSDSIIYFREWIITQRNQCTWNDSCCFLDFPCKRLLRTSKNMLYIRTISLFLVTEYWNLFVVLFIIMP